MTVERAQVGWGFWVRWILANTVGFSLGLPLGTFAASAALFFLAAAGEVASGTKNQIEDWFAFIGIVAAFMVGFGIVAAVAGIMQWLVLRRHLSAAESWLVASATGGAIGGALGFASWVIVGRDEFGVVSFSQETLTVAFTVVGAIVGIAQWLVLRGQVYRAGLWVLISTLGWAMGQAASGPAGRLGESLFYRLAFGIETVRDGFLPIAGFVVGFPLFGLLTGAITGVAMVWLLRQPVPETKIG